MINSGSIGNTRNSEITGANAYNTIMVNNINKNISFPQLPLQMLPYNIYTPSFSNFGLPSLQNYNYPTPVSQEPNYNQFISNNDVNMVNLNSIMQSINDVDFSNLVNSDLRDVINNLLQRGGPSG